MDEAQKLAADRLARAEAAIQGIRREQQLLDQQIAERAAILEQRRRDMIRERNEARNALKETASEPVRDLPPPPMEILGD